MEFTTIREEQRAAGWDQFMSAAPDDLKKWWLDYVRLLHFF